MNYKIESTAKFDKWYKSLKDIKTKDRLTQRISNMRFGHFGDHKQINTKLFELRFFFGSGYRVYYAVRNGEIILLLVGGDKSSQSKDIDTANNLLNNLEN